MSYFQKDFLLGASTAAHQVEGNNKNSDFWAMEQTKPSIFAEPSLDAVDHYNRYREDIDLLAGAGLNAYRFSIEWARIQPDKNTFVQKEIEHYRDMITYCREKGVTPIVTMQHFSSPAWLIREGGWEAETTVDYFARYCERVVKDLGGFMEYVCTINEANMGLMVAKIAAKQMKMIEMGSGADGEKPVNTVPTGLQDAASGGRESLMARMKAMGETFGMDPQNVHDFMKPRTAQGDRLIMAAHEKGRDAMKSVCPNLKVGVTLALNDIQSLPGGEELAEKERNDEFLHYLPFIKNDDFLGVQNYSRNRFGPEGAVLPPEGAELTQMGSEFYPQALENIIRYVNGKLPLPIIVTENGIATVDDARRVEFLRLALEGVKRCVDDGLPVKGYCYWSLMDNFEWQLGFSKTFGLIAIDRATQKRIPKSSLTFLGSYKNK
jgi:beta-glucosidase